ncbi:MAG: hypothetical protein V3V70_09065 [Candidatus Scalindua sp.]
MENLFRTKRQLPPLFLRQILEYTFARTLNDDKYFKEVEGEGIEKKRDMFLKRTIKSNKSNMGKM